MSYERLFENSTALVACCPVQPDLEQYLTVEESDSMQNCAYDVRNQAAAARRVARKLFAQGGFPDWSMPRIRGDAPAWPAGWIGSLSHSAKFAAAAITSHEDIAGIGIDIEPAEPLPAELKDAVIVNGDVGTSEFGDLTGRVLFCAKEASYKAVYPLDRQFLEFSDMTVNLNSGFAKTSYGRRIQFSVLVDHRIVVLAQLQAVDPGNIT